MLKQKTKQKNIIQTDTFGKGTSSTETAEFVTEASCEHFKCCVTYENQPNGEKRGRREEEQEKLCRKQSST